MTLKELCDSKESCLDCESKILDQIGVWCCILKKYVDEEYCKR